VIVWLLDGSTDAWGEREVLRLHARLRQILSTRGIGAAEVEEVFSANDTDGEDGLSKAELFNFCARRRACMRPGEARPRPKRDMPTRIACARIVCFQAMTSPLASSRPRRSKPSGPRSMSRALVTLYA
jgi:hypothetical protein